MLDILQEEAKALRKRNIKVFSEILDSMPSLTYCTTWSEAQQMLLDNPRFTEDPDLQSKSKLAFIFILFYFFSLISSSSLSPSYQFM